MKIALTFFAFLFITNTYAQVFENFEPHHYSEPERLGTFNNELVFFSNYTGPTSTNNNIGIEPCITGGTVASSSYIKNICLTISCFFSSLTLAEWGQLNNQLYFPTAGPNGTEPYITDGSIQGTQLLKDINPSGDSNPKYFFTFNNKLFFQADNGTNGIELWVTDGTSTGTTMLKDINPSGSSEPHSFIVFQGKLYFTANDGTNGAEIWVTDGTSAGTNIHTNIFTNGSSNAWGYTEYNNELIFWATDGTTTEPQLWKTNGTAGNKTKLANTYPFPQIGHYNEKSFTLYNGKLYFQAKDTADGFEPWYTDGTAAGTGILKDIFPYNNNCNFPSRYIVYNNKLYMNVKNIYWNLYVSDGTEVGTVSFNSLDNGIKLSKSANSMTVYNNKLYFFGLDSSGGKGLYESYGLPSNTQIIKPAGAVDSLFNYTSGRIQKANGALYFGANYDAHGEILWKYSTPAVVSTKDITKEYSNIKISPNPASDNLHIEFLKRSSEKYNLIITDLLGKSIIKSTLQSGTTQSNIDVSNLVSGTYICNIYNNKGRIMERTKIVVLR